MRSPVYRNILVVDDNRDSADSLAAILSLVGHEVRMAYGGRDAIARAMERPADVVFIDLAMPRVTGLDLLRELRDLPGMASAKLVCLTGFGDEIHRARAQAYGCDAYLVKPADLADVHAVLS